jgi:hypothetical protein
MTTNEQTARAILRRSMTLQQARQAIQAELESESTEQSMLARVRAIVQADRKEEEKQL